MDSVCVRYSLGLSFCLAFIGALPSGHLKPMGEHAPDRYTGPIVTFAEGELPSTQQMYNELASGLGRPALFKGAAKHMAAMQWTDETMARRFGDHPVDVEFAKKETRNADTKQMPLREFLGAYNRSDIYTVTDVSPDMMRDIELLPFMSCGGFTSLLDVVTMWMSSGGTKSVLHNDDQDNINCLFSGTKRMIFWSPHYRQKIQSRAFGWHNQAENPIAGGGYGSFAKFIDVEKVDLEKYPGWTELEWSDGDMEAGDCLFIPHKWYHTVASRHRNVAVNVWWWRNDDNGRNIRRDVEETPGAPLNEARPCQPQRFSLHDCTWGYENTGGRDWREVRVREHTHCSQKQPGMGISILRGRPGPPPPEPPLPTDVGDESEEAEEEEEEEIEEEERDPDADDDHNEL
eukprot:g1778.t1